MISNPKYIIIGIGLLICLNLKGQTTRIRGSVKDAENGEVLPFVNIAFKGTTIGTISSGNGEFFLETRANVDSLVVSFMGYEGKVFPVTQHIYQEIKVELIPKSIALEEIVVTPGENPAHAIIREIINHKEKNDFGNIKAYQCEIYNKLQLDISNIDEKTKNRKIFKHFQFVFDNIDTNVITGKTFLPVLISESVSDYYFREEPKLEREVIKAIKISGTENESVAQFSGKMYQKINIYDNFITILEPGFVSPIADAGLWYYKYYLLDTATIEGKNYYHISFKPKRKHERTFAGDMWVHDSTYAIKKFQMEMEKTANINFVNDIFVAQEYTNLDDSTWVIKDEKLFIDFNLNNRLSGFFGTKSTKYRDYKINTSLDPMVFNMNNDIQVNEGAIEKDAFNWDTIRPYELTEKEKNIYRMVDSIKNIPVFKTLEDIVALMVNYYYVIGDFEIGPYHTMYSYNPIEGNRFRLGGRTSNEFSTKLMISGYGAYGTLDEKFKYGLGFMYMCSKNPRRSFGANYEHDIQQLAQSHNAFMEDNILSSFLRRNPNYKLTLVNEFNAFYEHEWYQGFSNTLTFNHKEIFSTAHVPFIKQDTEGNIESLNSVIASEISIATRFAYNEKFLMGEFERVSLGSKFPIAEFTATFGLKGIWQGEYDYLRFDFNLSDKIETSPVGFFKYKLKTGKIIGDLPYPLLELHKGNETYAFDYFAFNMMNYYEFASDTWVSLFAEHHFQGFFLNHIPLLRKLQWREVVSARGLWGKINGTQQDVLMFPLGLHEVNTPYLEASVGIENILKIIRIDAMWRLTYLDHPGIQQFGLRAMLQLIL